MLYGGCERGFFFLLFMEKFVTGGIPNDLLGQMIECSVLRYGIFSHGKLAPT